MRKALIGAIGVLFLFSVAGVVVTAEKGSVYYVCNCQDNCACNHVSAKPGKCKCGSALVAMHALAVEKDKGAFCRCGADCTCKLSKDGKCGCGKPAKMVGLKGKYVCGCGPDCKCLTIADGPGKCQCGKALKQI